MTDDLASVRSEGKPGASDHYRLFFEAMDDSACLVERLPSPSGERHDYRYVAISRAMQEMFEIPDLAGQSIRAGLPEADGWYRYYDQVWETGRPLRVAHLSEQKDRMIEMFVARLEGDPGQRLFAIMKDVTSRWQDRQRLLLAELQHRVRNILGMVRSIVRQSETAHTDVEDYVRHLVDRLDAMGRTQVMLARAAGAKLDLESLVWDELNANLADERKVDMQGPKVNLSAKAAEVLTLAVHELAANSIKYGVLAHEGRLAIAWSRTIRGDEEWLNFTWQESCRSPGPEPKRKGFGTELIEQRVPYELKGEGSLIMTSQGMRAEIAFPLKSGASILETEPFSQDAQ